MAARAMGYLIVTGDAAGALGFNRGTLADALEKARELRREGFARVRIADAETGAVLNVVGLGRAEPPKRRPS